MKILKIVLIAIAVILGLLIVVGLFLPNTITVEESIVIDSPPNVPYSQVTNLRNMPKWDPWSKIDTTMETVYEGPIAGVGATRSWKSKDEQVKVGTMEIVKDEPFSFIKVDLELGEEGKADSYFKFNKVDEGKTEVTWGFYKEIDMPIFGGYLSFMIEMMVETNYKKGLESLKELSESIENQKDISDRKITIEKVESQTVICMTTATTQTDNDLAEKTGASYGQLLSNIQVNGMEMTGPPITVTTKWEENAFVFDNCIPVENIKGDLSAKVFESKTYSGYALKLEHLGSYDNLNSSYETILAYIAQMGLEITENPWEVYISDPSNTPEEKLITHIYFPIQ